MASHSITIALSACLLATSAYVGAADMEKEGWYVGAGIGYAQNKINNVDFASDSNQSNSATGLKLYAGYQFNDNWAAELEYANLGKFSNDSAYFHTSARASGLGMSALGMLPLSKEFTLLGKLGVFAKISDVEEYATSGNYSYSAKSVRLNPMAGIGAEYHLTSNITVRGEYEYFGQSSIGDNNAKLSNDLLSISVRYSF